MADRASFDRSGPAVHRLAAQLAQLSTGRHSASGAADDNAAELDRHNTSGQHALLQAAKALSPPSTEPSQPPPPQQADTRPKLKPLNLAPILARRLDAVSHSSASGSFSSKSSSSSLERHSPTRRTSSSSMQHEYTKLPSLLRTLEGKRQLEASPLVGSANLPQVPVAAGSPTAQKGGVQHSFEGAKTQVNNDLSSFRDEAQAMYDVYSMRTDPEAEVLEADLAKLLDITDECLESTLEDFKFTVTDIVDSLEEERGECADRAVRAMFTRLLFILSRCSRLLITEQQALFATEPRSRRQAGSFTAQMPARTASQRLGAAVPMTPSAKEEEELMKDDLFRCHTMPVKAMYDMVQKLHGRDAAQAAAAQGLGPRRPGVTFGFPEGRDEEVGLNFERRHSGPLLGEDRASPEPRSIMLESQFDRVADSQRTPPPPASGSSSGGIGTGRGKGMSSPLPTASTTPATKTKPKGIFKKIMSTFDNIKRRVSLQVLTPAPAPSRKKSDSGFAVAQSSSSSSARLQTHREPDDDKLAQYRSAPVSPTDHPDARATPKAAQQVRFAPPASAPPAAVSHFHAEQRWPHGLTVDPTSPPAQRSPPRSPMLPSLLPREIYGPDSPLDSLTSPCSPNSDDGLPVVCSICEEVWSSYQLEEHSELCVLLRKLGWGMECDALLTTLANFIEEQIELEYLPYSLRPEMSQLVQQARQAASLQPDGSKIPSTRCVGIRQELQDMLEPWEAARLHTITLTYARRIVQLITEKISQLSESLSAGRRDGRGASDTGTSTSGASTPRAAAGMTIEEFEIIKPISRGAFGRVYLARKIATGDLFAIKVMKKRDLIRKNMVESVTNERNILAMANNPFVVRFFYSFTSKENLYIVMEYINGGDCGSLLIKMGALDEEVVRMYAAETVLALEYCHAQGIIHRDMKPDNMLINSNGHIKLTDFGLSCVGVIDTTDNLTAEADGKAADDDMPSDAHMFDRNRGSTGGARGSGEFASEVSAEANTLEGDLAAATSPTLPKAHPVSPPTPGASGGAAPLAEGPGGRRISCPGSLSPLGQQPAPASPEMDMASSPLPHVQAGYSPPVREYVPTHLSPQRQSGSLYKDNSLPAQFPQNPAQHMNILNIPMDGSGIHTINSPREGSGNAPAGRLVVPESEKGRTVGTPDYLAPELLLGTGHGPEVDWWALGIIIYQFVVGVPPFNAASPELIFDNILDRDITWPDDEDDMSANCRDLIDKLLTPSPLRRFGHRGAGEIKLHPFFNGVDWTSLARTKATFIPAVSGETDTSYFEVKPISNKSMAEDWDKLKLNKVNSMDPVKRVQLAETAARRSSNSSGSSSMGIPERNSPSGLNPERCSPPVSAAGNSGAGEGSGTGGGFGGFGDGSGSAGGSGSGAGGSGRRFVVPPIAGFRAAFADSYDTSSSNNSHSNAGMTAQRRASSTAGRMSGSGHVAASSVAESSGSGSRQGSPRINSARSDSRGSTGLGPAGGPSSLQDGGGWNDRPSGGTVDSSTMLDDDGDPLDDDDVDVRVKDSDDGDEDEDGSPASLSSGEEVSQETQNQFLNFSFINLDGLTQSNREKMAKIREEHGHNARRSNTSGSESEAGRMP